MAIEHSEGFRRTIADLLLVMNQSALAGMLGVEQSTISRWANGVRTRVDYDTGRAVESLRRAHSRAIATAKRRAG